MARTNSTAQNKIDPTRPFYAAVGGVDVAVAYARTGLTEAQTRLAKVDFEPKALADGFQKEAKAIPSRVEAIFNELVSDLTESVTETADDLNKQYVDLAARGRTLVNRIRGQEATKQAKAQAKKTTTRAKTTATQTKKAASTAKESAQDSAKTTATRTRKAASTVKSSAKATGTSARKTASATTKAAEGAAAKTGA